MYFPLLFVMSMTQLDTGKQLYYSNCIRCHNVNPSLPGNIGPELKSTPVNVFHDKIKYGQYPEGYKPKRNTKIMPKFKLIDEQIDKIIKYIKEFK